MKTILTISATILATLLLLGISIPELSAQIVQSGNFMVDLSSPDAAPIPPGGSYADLELLSNPGFETGSFPPWTHDGAWTISTTGPHTGTYCAYDIGNHWLRQDFTPTPSAQIVSATLWCKQPESAISAIDFMYSDGSYSEDLIWPTPAWQQFNVTAFIDPGMIVIGIRVWGYSGGGPNPDETFFDDFSIQTAGGAPNITITMTPVNPPIIIPAGGGSFSYNATISNNENSSQTCGVWVMVTLPNGNPYGPVLGPITLTLPAGLSITRNRSQSVPASAPPGNYTYTGNVGSYPSTIYDSDSFPFTKSTTDGGALVGEWTNSGESFEAGLNLSAPAEFRLLGNYPNPFNPATRIRYTLPAADHVRIAVYDIRGDEVSILQDGYQNAGLHEVVFDGSLSASGIYLYRLETGGAAATGKMILMK
jgi:hypothetical protein